MLFRLTVLFSIGWMLGFSSICGSASASTQSALETRYLPYAQSEVERVFDGLSQMSKRERYWRTISEIRSTRSEGALPLSGLRLVLDPGHIGGRWAEVEARNFRIQEDDFWVREGDLVLEVALEVERQLELLGAEVYLTRSTNTPLNQKPPAAYVGQAMSSMLAPELNDLEALNVFTEEVIEISNRLAAVSGELMARARWINDEVQPDAVISLHINAAPWPEGERALVKSNHLHVLVFGCLNEGELNSSGQEASLLVKLQNGSGLEEAKLGMGLARHLRRVTGLPATAYEGTNAKLLEESEGYVWARNLLLLRRVECPIVLLEPYVANSQVVYDRLQAALSARANGSLETGDILMEYVAGVIEGVLEVYGDE